MTTRKKEIGGYLELERLVSHEYHQDLMAFNTARHSLLYLIFAKGIQKIYLPSFLCDCVEEICQAHGVVLSYYSIDRNFRPILPEQMEEHAFLYVVNYYGQLRNEEILALKKRHTNLILDNVQAFFRRPLEGVDTVYSCRKFFGVPDGGYLATTCVAPSIAVEQDISRERMTHVLGRFEGCASEFYGSFQETDESFRQVGLKGMSALTHNILGAVDYERVHLQRNENYGVLDHLLHSRNVLELCAPNGPYCYPFYCKDGMNLKRKLAARKIYVPTLWPNVLASNNALEKDYAENILPLPCDQRYRTKDMEYLARTLIEEADCR